jgi:hypothetical protein
MRARQELDTYPFTIRKAHTMLTQSLRAIGVAAAAALVLLFAPSAHAQPLLPMPDSGSTSFGNWSFSWEIGNANDEGLVLKNVFWKGVKVLHKASMPVIRVKYRGNGADIGAGCGPYNDRIHSGNLGRFNGQVTDVIARASSATT